MNHLARTVLIAVASTAVLGVVSPSIADDSATGTPPKTNEQLMKECMKKQKAANTGMSEADMRKSCKDQIKAHVDDPNAPAEPVVPAH